MTEDDITEAERLYQRHIEAAEYQRDLIDFGLPDEEETRRIAEQANQSEHAKSQKLAVDDESAEPELENDDAEAQQLASLEEASRIEAARGDREEAADFMLGEVDATEMQAAADEREAKRRNALAKGVVDRYNVNGKHYMVPGADKLEAFTDNGKQIKVKIDDEGTVRDVVNLLVSRGATSINVSGTAVLKRHAWMAAQRHGVAVTGYRPTAQDMALYQKQVPENVITDTTEQAAFKPTATDRLSGKLVAHGAAPWRHDATKQPSYYVTVSSGDQAHTQWGVGLKSAVSKAGVQVGDTVTLRNTNTEGVTVKDKQGNEVAARRAEWVIDAPERDELNKAAVLREAAKAVSTKFSAPADRELMVNGMDERITNHAGPLPAVKIHKQVEQIVPVQRQEQKQQQTQ